MIELIFLVALLKKSPMFYLFGSEVISLSCVFVFPFSIDGDGFSRSSPLLVPNAVTFKDANFPKQVSLSFLPPIVDFEAPPHQALFKPVVYGEFTPFFPISFFRSNH